MFRFKFQQNRTINEEFYFMKGGRGQRDPHLWILISIIFRKYMKMFCFKFQKNQTINEKFYFLKGGRGQGDPYL